MYFRKFTNVQLSDKTNIKEPFKAFNLRMTAFTKDDLPASIDTIEKLAAWAGMALHALNLEITAIEGAGSPEPAAQFGTYFVQETRSSRIIVRQSIELTADYAYGSGKLWTYAKELSSNSLPSEFTEDSIVST